MELCIKRLEACGDRLVRTVPSLQVNLTSSAHSAQAKFVHQERLVRTCEGVWRGLECADPGADKVHEQLCDCLGLQWPQRRRVRHIDRDLHAVRRNR